MITKKELIEWGKRHGWKIDRWENLTRESQGSNGMFRLKLQKASLRLEFKDYHDVLPQEWERCKTVYYRNLRFIGDHLKGLLVCISKK